MDKGPEEIELAVEIIRQLENLDYSPETILQAMAIICRDTLGKLPEEERPKWRDCFQKHLND
ncbi:MAG: DUF2496 domain-containing protein [Endozoicomonas sp.]